MYLVDFHSFLPEKKKKAENQTGDLNRDFDSDSKV